MTRVLVAGFSARAAAESAARAGFAVTAIDAFADLDQHPDVRAVAMPPGTRFTARAAVHAARDVECDAVAYLANFENHPAAVATLASGRTLWGNPPHVLRRVRDPVLLSEALQRRGFVTPLVRLAPDTEADRKGPPRISECGAGLHGPRWLLKPLRSGGGRAIAPWTPGSTLPRGSYLQEHIEGTPGSIVFVAAGGRAVPLGICRQLVGEEAFGATGYQYCGNILDASLEDELMAGATALASAVVEEFGLVGVNGIDFIARGRVPYAIEVNPRWCASMELVERSRGLSVFGAHAAACAGGAVPEFDLQAARRATVAVGKAIVFARADVRVGKVREWLGDPTVRDVPQPGQRIPQGSPICTVFASGPDAPTCHEALRRRVAQVYEVI